MGDGSVLTEAATHGTLWQNFVLDAAAVNDRLTHYASLGLLNPHGAADVYAQQALTAGATDAQRAVLEHAAAQAEDNGAIGDAAAMVPGQIQDGAEAAFKKATDLAASLKPVLMVAGVAIAAVAAAYVIFQGRALVRAIT